MKKHPSRGHYLRATLATLGALLLPGAAAAHVDIRPTFGEVGTVTEVRVELPKLRPGPGPEALEVEGDGVEVLSSRLQGELGAETVWGVRLRPTGGPGRILLVLRARYADGESVEVDASFTAVPPPEEPFPWAVVAGAGGLVVALTAGALAAARRRRG